jgi:hypothetical protein
MLVASTADGSASLSDEITVVLFILVDAYLGLHRDNEQSK